MPSFSELIVAQATNDSRANAEKNREPGEETSLEKHAHLLQSGLLSGAKSGITSQDWRRNIKAERLFGELDLDENHVLSQEELNDSNNQLSDKERELARWMGKNYDTVRHFGGTWEKSYLGVPGYVDRRALTALGELAVDSESEFVKDNYIASVQRGENMKNSLAGSLALIARWGCSRTSLSSLGTSGGKRAWRSPSCFQIECPW